MPAASVGRAEPEAPVAGVVPAVAAGRAVEAATAGKAVAAGRAVEAATAGKAGQRAPAVNPARAGWAAHPAPVEPPANQVSPANQDNRGNPAARDISACGWRRRA
ncbi:hypothetical protein [Mycobacterium tuberculosis]|uniref:hypothetical protein n=1 Tax=Mycobacterium tuberculosis TaxID=1773 RepID=UPI000679A08C|nr:hypothetical protein [Mycobacterium tuberculosis]